MQHWEAIMEDTNALYRSVSYIECQICQTHENLKHRGNFAHGSASGGFVSLSHLHCQTPRVVPPLLSANLLFLVSLLGSMTMKKTT